MKSIIILIFSFISIFPQINIQETQITDGVIHKKIINQNDTLVINILKVDVKRPDLTIRTVKANELLNTKETTSQMVSRYKLSGYHIVAAINADFFEDDGEVISNMISNGEIVKAVKFSDSPYNSFTNSQFASDDEDNLFIDQFVFSGNLILPNGNVEEIRRVNSNADSNSITIFNRFQGKSTPVSLKEWYVVDYVLFPLQKNGDTLVFITTGKTTLRNYEIPEQGVILSANNKFAYYLDREIKIGDTLKIIYNFSPKVKNIKSLIGGWPVLVKDGMNMVRRNPSIEGITEKFSKQRHPRSGIGFSSDKRTLYFITVDGRQQMSRGMTLLEFANLMITEGVYNGLNLDGGGSTTLVINDKVVNSPSDLTGERLVGNCIMIIRQ
ncbi:Exopolysaccharide biosynthesis protein [Ignavibacterium album JCM 16511]|uniref:Exopolysaccharide biosynthesis protein n=1 Tax=Ignavibacterium album (strain DSM 19864 / JCM 16511 / NBRC 101810 / Mat9-16) TaxID=945713 RepID=I0AHT7_IGNAJ|nr:phosphodiester glycosidase family protein [Ignavibacterium album]AFH48544.1 Exopolysaccharide biosynthesis protein [Ignavibacterium album JCM 16511]